MTKYQKFVDQYIRVIAEGAHGISIAAEKDQCECPHPYWPDRNEASKEGMEWFVRYIFENLTLDAFTQIYSDEATENFLKKMNEDWNAEKVAGGWTNGQKSSENKTHYFIGVSWEDLPQLTKKKLEVVYKFVYWQLNLLSLLYTNHNLDDFKRTYTEV